MLNSREQGIDQITALLGLSARRLCVFQRSYYVGIDQIIEVDCIY